MSDYKVKAIAPWFGGKRSLAPAIVEHLGKHSMYVEPFCGSMAVLFAKEESSIEIANDLHGQLINLARVIQSDGHVELFDRIQRTLYTDDLFDQSIEFVTANPSPVCSCDVESAYHYFIASWMGRNGVAGTQRTNYQKATRWTPGGGAGPRRIITTAACIPAWSERLRNVDIQSMDAFEMLKKISDKDDVAIYVDPPYAADTRGSAKYEHDFEDATHGVFANQDDHARLARLLSRFRNARVLVSYYDSPKIRELYRGWQCVEMYRQKNLHVQNRRGTGNCVAPEILLINHKGSMR